MVEAIQCPSCQTRYGLRPTRVRTGLRRAQCFRCGDIFHIDAEVKRMLAELEPASTSSVPLETLAAAMQQAPEAAAHEAPAHETAAHDATADLEAQDLGLSDLEIPEPDFETPSAPALPSPNETAPIPSMAAAIPMPPPPEPPTPVEDAPEPEAGGTYASAKDAIARLFGDTPMAPSPTEALRGALSGGRDLDTEAGMRALEDTLGGVPASALSTKPFIAPVPEVPADLLTAPAATEPAMQETDLPHASATMRLTAAEVAAAAGSVTSKAPEPPEITQEEVTMVLPPPPAPPAPTMDPTDPSALRLRIGDQVYNGLDLTTLAKWIEEGRVLEDHQVARGTSETWMDAAKVPALRPVFERLRRSRMGGDLPMPPASGIGDTGAKKGLFGGMFGKKD